MRFPRPLTPFLLRLRDPARPERAIAMAVLLGAATLIDPAKRSPAGRAALRLALAGGAAAVIASERPSDFDGRTRATLAAVTGGAVLGLAEVGESLDGRLQRRLLRSGVRRPRLALALGTVLLSLLLDDASIRQIRRERARNAEESEVPEDPVPGTGELPRGARALVEGMLDFTGDYDSRALRGQLGEAREQLWNGKSGAWGEIDLLVPRADGLPRVVPHSSVFPVIARFADPESGAPREVRLRIEDGYLAQLTLANAAAPDAASDAEGTSAEWPSAWPVRAEIQYRLESPAP